MSSKIQYIYVCMCVFAIVKTHLLYKDGELCEKKGRRREGWDK